MNTAPNPQQALVFANDARPRDRATAAVEKLASTNINAARSSSSSNKNSRTDASRAMRGVRGMRREHGDRGERH